MSHPKQVIRIAQYKTNVGYFIRRVGGYSYESLIGYIVNGVKLTTPFNSSNWFKIDSEVTKVEVVSQEKKILVGLKLIRPEIVSESIPEFIDKEYLQYDEVEERTCLSEPYSGLDPLYKYQYEIEPASLCEVEFELIDKGTYFVDEQFDLTKREIRVQEDKVVQSVDISGIVNYDEFASIITPEFAIHTAPCELSSAQVYKIVREFIKQNIDRKSAAITSDYDFCFTVKKKVSIKPYLNEWTEKQGRKNIKINKTVDSKEVQIFEMTYSGYRGNQGYEGYTCIPGIKGKNLQNLYDKLTDYLQNIIEIINTPIVECEHCNGTGHHIQKWKHK